MLCLGIETSCDETALALVADGRLLGQALSSQVDAHAVFGGVVPEIASREHLRLLPVLYDRLLAECGVRPAEIDLVAVARGPGLLGSLLVGVGFAKGLALSLGCDLIGVNHLWAHLLAPGLERPVAFPALGLLVSGGHTHTYRIASPTEFELLGRTLDDAAGEAYDKVAKLLNFPYPGGRFLDELGQGSEPDPSLFPRPYVDNDSLDFSFSGLKTAVSTYLERHSEFVPQAMLTPDAVAARGLDALLAEAGIDRAALGRVCASFNLAVAETLRIKVERALHRTGEVRSLIVAGGVAANSFVRSTMAGLAESSGVDLVLPSLPLCTDNAAMIAYAGERTALAGYHHGLDLEAVPRGQAVPADWGWKAPKTGRSDVSEQ